MYLLLGVSLIRGLLTHAHLPGMSTASPVAMQGIARGGTIFVSLIAAGIYWFFLEGFEWARWLVMIGSVLGLIGLRRLRTAWERSHFSGAQLVVEVGFDIFLLVYLNTRPARDWFRSGRITSTSN